MVGVSTLVLSGHLAAAFALVLAFVMAVADVMVRTGRLGIARKVVLAYHMVGTFVVVLAADHAGTDENREEGSCGRRDKAVSGLARLAITHPPR